YGATSKLQRRYSFLSRGGACSRPCDSVGANRVIETFKRNFAKVFERQCLSFAQLGDDVGHEDLFCLRVRTKPRSELHGDSKQIIMVFDRFASGDSKPNIKWTILVLLTVPGNFALNTAGALNGSGRGHERCHDAVSQMLNFAAAQLGQSVAHNRIVHL